MVWSRSRCVSLVPFLLGAPACADGTGGTLDGAWAGSDGGTTTAASVGETQADDAPGSEASTSDGDADTSPPHEESSSTGGVENDCPRVRIEVAVGASLNVRPSPSTQEDPIGSLPNKAIADVLAAVVGESIDGNDLWYSIVFGDLEGFVFSEYATCTFDEAPELLPPDAYWLPLACGVTANVSQGNFGSFSHQGKAAYAFDFALGVGTPMVAMADGIVIHTYAETKPGDPCYDGGDASCFPYANLVVLLHGDGTTTLYKHLSAVSVGDGELVLRGGEVGLSGSTGYSTGRHAHVMRMEDCGEPNCQSIALEFADVLGGVPTTGQSVTSGNCP